MHMYPSTDPYQADFLEILVFKTNIGSEYDLKKVGDALAKETRIKGWNVDQDDVDKVLRIESHHLHPLEVIRLMHQAGYCCEELPD